MSLLSNIHYIVRKHAHNGEFAYDEKNIGTLVDRITKNFYSPYGSALALIAQKTYRTTLNRELTENIFDTIYELEIDWRMENEKRTFYLDITNPASFNTYGFIDLLYLDPSQADKIETKLKSLVYTEFLRTPYWRCVRAEALRLAHYQCFHCEREKDLNVHHISYHEVIGRDHENMDNLVVLCEQCHLAIHLDIEPTPKKVM